jgi:hypothetical protein
MMTVRDATQKAIKEFSEVFQNGYQNVRLEEIEISDDERYWYVTLGYDDPSVHPAAALSRQLGVPAQRAYKVVKIDDMTGKVISIKIRSV